jgi:hypothetical protein
MYHQRTALQPVGAFGAADFSSQIADLKEIARGIETAKVEPLITVATAKKLLEDAIIAGKPMTDKAQEMIGSISNLAVTSQIQMAAGSVFDSIQSNLLPILVNIIRPAQASGQALVSSSQLQRALPKHIRAIIRGYETLHFLESIKPLPLRILGATMGVVATIGKVWETIAEVVSAPFLAAVEAAKDAADAADKGLGIAKWLTIGGLGFLVYWYGIRK